LRDKSSEPLENLMKTHQADCGNADPEIDCAECRIAPLHSPGPMIDGWNNANEAGDREPSWNSPIPETLDDQNKE
jgi:hypothetical protein